LTASSALLKKSGYITAVGNIEKPKAVDVTNALKILKESSVLKIDDLLPLFPEEAKVEEMKGHLCTCLDDYNQKILDLKVRPSHPNLIIIATT
jgi:hypothetical protein